MRFKILRHGGYGATGIATTGGNMSGPLVLAGAPTNSLEASTKGYVDSALGNLNGASLITGLIPVERLPAFTGDIVNVAGSNSFALTDAGITPGSYPRVTVNAKGRITNGYLLTEADLPALDWSKITTGKPTTMAGYGITDAINPAGGVMTGMLTVNNDPTAPLHVATKGYIDNLVAGSAGGSLKAGDMVRKVSSVTPAGFLRCNGGDVSKTTYAALYAVVGDTFSLAGGYGSGKPWEQQYDINTIQVNDITGWNTQNTFTYYPGKHTAVVLKNRVNIMFVNNTATMGYNSLINSDGTFAGWFQNGVVLPPNVSRLACNFVVTSNKLYMLGGYNNGVASSPEVYSATINADGTIGAWTQEPNMPGGTDDGYAFVVGNRIYMIAGELTGVPISAVYTTTINANGSLNTWTSAPSLPSVLTNFTVAVIKNRVYVFGGYSAAGGGYRNTIYTTTLNTDGTMNTWSTYGTLPTISAGGVVYVTKNKVYLFAGYNGTAWTTNVYTTPINADGTLGTWVSGTSLTQALSGMTVIATSSKLLLIGQRASDNTNYALWADITGGLNDYSSYYDGTITQTNTTNFRLPDFSAKELPGSYTYVKY